MVEVIVVGIAALIIGIVVGYKLFRGTVKPAGYLIVVNDPDGDPYFFLNTNLVPSDLKNGQRVEFEITAKH